MIYLLISELGDEYHSWVIFFRNALQKEPDLPLLNIVTSQLLDESRLTNKFRASNLDMALFSFTSKKCKVYLISSTSMQDKLMYNKARAKYIYYKKSYYEAVNC